MFNMMTSFASSVLYPQQLAEFVQRTFAKELGIIIITITCTDFWLRLFSALDFSRRVFICLQLTSRETAPSFFSLFWAAGPTHGRGRTSLDRTVARSCFTPEKDLVDIGVLTSIVIRDPGRVEILRAYLVWTVCSPNLSFMIQTRTERILIYSWFIDTRRTGGFGVIAPIQLWSGLVTRTAIRMDVN